MKQSVRIIGGRLRGKKLPVPTVDGLRPTPDRVRETLFNWLMRDIHEARCLDAFAGSGALGLEAFSRGAMKVTLLEQAPKAYANLQQLIKSLDSSQLKLIQTDAQVYLRTSIEPFDLIFLDPPYALDCLTECLNSLAEGNSLVQNGLVYWESSTMIQVNETQWEVMKQQKAGSVFYGLLKKL